MLVALLLSVLAVDACAAAAGKFEHLGFGGHGGVARGGHGQRAVRRAVLHRGLKGLAGQQPIDQARRERVTAADAVQDLQPLAVGGLDDTGGWGPGDRAQSLMLAVCTVRIVVAMTWKLG
jgi:hypothetical protein